MLTHPKLHNTPIDWLNAGDRQTVCYSFFATIPGMTVLYATVESSSNNAFLISDCQMDSLVTGEPLAGDTIKTLRINSKIALGFSGSSAHGNPVMAALMEVSDELSAEDWPNFIKFIEDRGIEKPDLDFTTSCTRISSLIYFLITSRLSQQELRALNLWFVMVGEEDGVLRYCDWRRERNFEAWDYKPSRDDRTVFHIHTNPIPTADGQFYQDVEHISRDSRLTPIQRAGELLERTWLRDHSKATRHGHIRQLRNGFRLEQVGN